MLGVLEDSINSNVLIVKSLPLITMDSFVGQHCYNTSKYSLKLSELLLKKDMLSDAEKEILSDKNFILTTAFLHDIGKLFITNEILHKPVKLNDEEICVIRRHPALGANYLQDNLNDEIRNKDLILDTIRHHHEHWDGKGYPDKLKGEAIPILSRIVCIADAFDAMTFERPYSRAKTKKDALKELERCAGTQFDPTIVEVLLNNSDYFLLL